MPKQFYSASEAAKLLGISLDTLRRWDRAGRIETARDSGNRRSWRQPRSGVCVATATGAPERPQSAQRHGFRGKVEGLIAQVELVVDEPARLVAIVTADAVEELGLKPGMAATAVVKATSVMVEHA